MDTKLEILGLSLLLVILIFPFGIGKHLFKGVWLVAVYSVFSPYYLTHWFVRRRKARVRRNNYEILGQYVALLGNNPTAVAYFKSFIEKGISSANFLKLLEAAVVQARQLQNPDERETVQKQLEEQKKIQEMAAEQEVLLNQSRLSLEQIKFREKLLENLYQKIQRKYRL